MKYRILTEASGSLTSSYLIKSIQEAGHTAIGSDISECAATFLADDFIIMPKHNDPDLWVKVEKILIDKKINIVIPSFDETLYSWAERKEYFYKKNIHIIISNPETLVFCQDKWNTFNFFKKAGIPTPETSLENKYPLIKPRQGRGGKDIYINHQANEMQMEGMISQELLIGDEYTIDVFCTYNHNPIYVIPRKRLQVKDGKSINGITEKQNEIINWVKKICTTAKFLGPINIQCFVSPEKEIKFTEINPRIAGGMALGFAASENWINLIIHNLIEKKDIEAKEIKFGLKMFRYYDEVFVS